MPFMPAATLNQLRCALQGWAWSCFGRFSSIGFFFLFSPPLFCRFNLLAFHNVCCPNASLLWVLGLSFYPLEQASKHGDLCNEQISDSNERFNLNRGGS